MQRSKNINVNNLFIDIFYSYDIIHMNKHSYVHSSGVTKEEQEMTEMEKLMDDMPVEEQVYELAELFKMLSDPTRVKILYSILDTELSVGEITEVVGSTQSAVSHQLRVLKQARLVKYHKAGKSVIYSVSDEHVATILSMGMEHISE